MEFLTILIIIGSYFLGCINTGYYYTRICYKKDIREVGTNVTGALNVSRIAGKKGFVITFLGDALKGSLVVILCRVLKVEDYVSLLGILFVLTGHILPFQLKFRGGKGFSTAFGAFLIYQPFLILILFITGAMIFIFVRRYTITGIFALTVLPMELFVADYPWRVIVYFALYSLLIIFACRNNLKEYIKTRAYEGKQKANGKTKY